MQKAPPVLARVLRSNRLESEHRGHIAVVDAAGKLLFSAGDPRIPVYLRSAAKPFQALPLLEDHLDTAFGFSEAELALACASHNGEKMHVDAAQAMLDKLDLPASLLRCGIHRPLGVELNCVDEDGNYNVLQNNCSGKHCGMLASCKWHGWPYENYIDPAHAHQQRILGTIAKYAGVAEAEIGIGIDGCSVPVFNLPLDRVAWMYARLATDSGSAARVFHLMSSYPELVAGTRRFDTAMMLAMPGRIIAKTGAEGLECLALRQPQAIGIAIKIADGNNRAVPPVVLKLLQHLNCISPEELHTLSAYEEPRLFNHRKVCVGRIASAGFVPPRA